MVCGAPLPLEGRRCGVVALQCCGVAALWCCGVLGQDGCRLRQRMSRGDLEEPGSRLPCRVLA